MKIHIISHSHWDREWYMPYEQHHMRLIELIDDIILQKDTKDFKSFYLDGQTISINDYLEVRPQNKKILLEMIKNKKILIGPWYILQDAFLVNSELHIKNLQHGYKEAKKYGNYQKIGYFPDTFGIMGQAAQILQQANIDNMFFGRGVKPTGFKNIVKNEEFASKYSEMDIQAPDGSKVLGILFANWYSNGNEIPINKNEAKIFWEIKIKEAKQYASTNHLLFMNGCDHQPLQKNISEAIKIANEIYEEHEFIHSNLEDYVKEIKKEKKEDLITINDELYNQTSDGFSTLINTASSRLYMKYKNYEVQNQLINIVEPLYTMLNLKYPNDELEYATKYLMQNHPHDSICGCSVDEVHQENMLRYMKSFEVLRFLEKKALHCFQENVQIKSKNPCLTIFNTFGLEKKDLVTYEFFLKKAYYHDSEVDKNSLNIELPNALFLENNEIPCVISDLGLEYGCDLPKDSFRQPFFGRKIKIEFMANIPGFSYQTYELKKILEKKEKKSLFLENEFLKIEILENSINITKKRKNEIIQNAIQYVDVGDIGNEYVFFEAKDKKRIKSNKITIEKTIQNEVYSEVTYSQKMLIPISATELLTKEQDEYVWFTQREATRHKECKEMKIYTTLRLLQNTNKLNITTEFKNECKDHRLRIQLKTNINTNNVNVDSIFEIKKRTTIKPKTWLNEDFSKHQAAFINLNNKENNMTIANRGLNEYEIKGDIAEITLVRSVGELGDFGVFKTPEAQCLIKHKTHLQIIFEENKFKSYIEGYKFQTDFISTEVFENNGTIKEKNQFLKIEGNYLVPTSLHKNNNQTYVRLFNMSLQKTNIKFSKKVSKTNIMENKRLKMNNEVKKAEIITFRIEEK